MNFFRRFSAAFAAALLVALAFSGCGVFRKRKRAQPAAAAEVVSLVGTVALVNEESRFILIDTGNLPTPDTGLHFRTMRDGARTGVVKTGAEHRRPFVVAEIVEGAPQKGDRVVP